MDSIDRCEMAEQWLALQKLFKKSHNTDKGDNKNDIDLIHFKNGQSWVFARIHKMIQRFSFVVLVFVYSDFIGVTYHKDQANEKNYSNKGLEFSNRNSEQVFPPGEFIDFRPCL